MDKVKSKLRMQRYRAAHRRIDYAPSPAALAAIERHFAEGKYCIAGIIDYLVEAGDKAVAGNVSKVRG